MPIKTRAWKRNRRRERRADAMTIVGGVLATAALLSVIACATRPEKAREISNELVYFKDHRTDLCFAYWSNDGSDRRDGMMTVVPCEQVAHLLVNGAERP